MFCECGVLNIVFGQVPEVEGVAITEPTSITGFDRERQSTPSRYIEEGGSVERPAKQKAWGVCAFGEMGEVFGWENSEGEMFGENSLPLKTLLKAY